GKELGDQMPLYAVSRTVQQRGESPQPALARRDGDDPAADSALAGQPNVVKQTAGDHVKPWGRNYGRGVVADYGVAHASPGERIQPAVSQGCTHHRQILGAHVEGALPGVEVSRLCR